MYYVSVWNGRRKRNVLLSFSVLCREKRLGSGKHSIESLSTLRLVNI